MLSMQSEAHGEMRLKFKIASSNTGTWRVALWRGFSELPNTEGIDLPDIAEISLGAAALHLFTWLECLEQKIEKYSFSLLFSDAFLMEWGRNDQFVQINGRYNHDPSVLWVVMSAFYKAVGLFLCAENRYKIWDARLIYLFSAWQRYNLLKELCLAKDRYENLQYELAEAYRTLAQLLTDRQFTLAARWLSVWRNQPARQSQDDDPLLRDRMRLSMVLQEEPNPELLNPRKPILVANCFSYSQPDWTKTYLHPVFTLKESTVTAVRQLITEWALPRYDLISSLQLAYLLRHSLPRKNNKSNNTTDWNALRRCGLSLLQFWVSFLLTPCIVIASVILCSLAISSIGGLNASNTWLYRWTALEFLITVVGVIVYITRFVDFNIIPYLALPRLVGGVMVGFTALVLQEDSLKLSQAINSRGCFLVALFWFCIIFVGFVYLYFDAHPWALDKRETLLRARLTAITSIIVSAYVGLFMVAFATSAYRYPETVNTHYFLGPIGWVDLNQWLAFVPIALFTGLITQFIFEERTVTSSVWAPNQE